MTAAIITLLVGGLVGYLSQRSRMCFVGGIRDFILIRDTYLLRGLIAFGRHPRRGQLENTECTG